MTQSLDNTRYCPACGAVYADDTDFCPKDGTAVEQKAKIVAGRYVLKATIGLGNMGTVHRAVQLPIGREVAVKLLHPDLVRNPEMVARFEQEALAASTVDHQNAITIYDCGRSDDGQVYIAMEYLDGENLATLLHREHHLPPTRALELWVPTVKAMVVAHRKGIVHRDLKPENIFIARKVNEEGQTEEVVKVLDFGIAKLLQASRGGMKTMAGARMGTALYMSPEQLEGQEVGKFSDVYALVLILVEMLTGRMPWGQSTDVSDTVMTMMRLVTPPRSLADMVPGGKFSPELQKVIDEGLAVAPADRPQDGGELLKRLATVPEAQALANASSRRSDVSQMFSAALMSAAMNKPTGAERDGTATAGGAAGLPGTAVGRPAAEANKPAVAGKALSAFETLRTNVPSALIPGAGPTSGESAASDLPAAPTVVTAKGGAAGGEKSGAPLAAEPTRPRLPPPAKPLLSTDKTMPQPMPAPRLPGGLSIDDTPPTRPLPQLNPAMVAVLRENGNNANTLERQLRSTVTLGRRPITRGWFVWLLIWLAVLALLGAGYFLWGAKDALFK